MFKFIVTLTLSLTVFAAVASSDQLTAAPTQVKGLQVIVQNEAVAPGLCRLYFENDTTKDVACD
ncbi:hypothetical protein J9253_20330 [Thiothrix litoralis]|jgi:hypothetical protein|uniref:Uncharacterized protein n=1 Tax=Thiothrix litoralis TaxID=2891210 RepID=A0ABX7WQY1_9GAMM|nr:hypothetical protein [Thiothrix litoralis]QTR46286.1 hypothetical protein J9253_20330 [Thiothrix litoralis]